MSRLMLIVLLALSALHARTAGAGDMFGQGQTHLLVAVGSGYALHHEYRILGAGVSHYVVDGLGVGISYESWSGDGPGISKTTPSVQYVFYQPSSVRPFIGGFYRHTSVSGLPSLNSAGVRAGVYIAVGSSTAVGVGLVHESYLDCQESVYSTCNESYPEISFTFGF